MCPLTFNNKIYRLFSRYLENWFKVMAVKEKGPIFECGTKSCCDGFRFVYKMRRQRTPPVLVCAFFTCGADASAGQGQVESCRLAATLCLLAYSDFDGQSQSLQKRRVEWWEIFGEWDTSQNTFTFTGLHFVSQMLANLWRMNIAYNLIRFPFDFVF